MQNTITALKEKLIADVDLEISELQRGQLVRFRARGNEYIYARAEGKDHWAVPGSEQDGLKELLGVIRRMEDQIQRIKIDELVAKKFISRYYRTQSDVLVAAETMGVGYSVDANEECVAARNRVDRSRETMHSLRKLLRRANRRNRENR